jgi:hypothetical protein
MADSSSPLVEPPAGAPADDPSLSEIVDDAILIARFGSRTGRFHDATLFHAIQKMKSGGTDWNNPAVVELQSALNDAISVLHPITLADLRNWDPFTKSPKTPSGKKWGKTAFLAGAVALMMLCGYYTVWQKKAAALLAEITAAEALPQDRLVNELIFFAGGGNETGDQAGLATIPIADKVDELRAIDERKFGNTAAFNELYVSSIILRPAWYRIRNAFVGPSLELVGAAEASPRATPLVPAVLADAPPGCGDADAAPGLMKDVRMGRLQSDVNQRDALRRQVYCIVKIDRTRYIGGPDAPKMIAMLTYWIDLLGMWLLPGFYGALGAVMYFMRNFLDPLLPEPGVMKVVLRVCMGLFAGVSVAWVWAPSAMIQGIGITDVSLAAITMAFLVGFGIEVFFALLDRLVTMISGTISKGDAPAAKA